MQALRSLLQNLVVFGLMGVFGILGVPLVLWSRAWTLWWMKVYVRWSLAATRIICGLRCEVRGPVPSGPVVVASKHQSLLDVLMLFQALPEPHFVMKRELVWVPIFGQYALRIGCIWVVREQRGQGQTMLRRLQKGWSGSGQIVIYPQGTRVPPGTYKPYRRGAALAYAELGLPMVLAATNVGWFWPKKGFTRRPGTAVLEFLETVPPGLPRDEVMRKVEASIEAASDRLGEEARRQIEHSPG